MKKANEKPRRQFDDNPYNATFTLAEPINMKTKLKDRVQMLIRKCENYALLVDLNRTILEKIRRLECCVMCLYRNKTILLTKVQYILDCKESRRNEKTIICLEAELKQKTEDVANMCTEIANLRESRNQCLTKKDEADACATQTAQEGEELSRENRQLVDEVAVAKRKNDERRKEFEKAKNEMVYGFEQSVISYKEQEKSHHETLENFTTETATLRDQIQIKAQKTADLKAQIRQNIEEKKTILERTGILAQNYETLNQAVEDRDEDLQTCHQDRVEMVKKREEQEQEIVKVKKDIEIFQSEKEMSEVQMASFTIIRESNEMTQSRFSRFIKKLTDENAYLHKRIEDLKLPISDEGDIENLKETIQNLSGNIKHLLKNFDNFLGDKICFERETDKLKICFVKILKRQKRLHGCDMRKDCNKDREVIEQKKQLCQILQNVGNAKDFLIERIGHLEKNIIDKDDHLKELKEERKELCLNYEKQWAQTEMYEQILEKYLKNKNFLERNADILSKNNEALLNKEGELKEKLEKLRGKLTIKTEERDVVLNENKDLVTKLKNLEDMLKAEQDNSRKLKNQAIHAFESQYCNFKETLATLDKTNRQRNFLEGRNAFLNNECHALNSKFNLLIEGNRILENIIEIQKCEIQTLPSEEIYDIGYNNCYECQCCDNGSQASSGCANTYYINHKH
ncbi:hypothetical protein M8J76_009268 [Diaphorina citri]|nr:hypothetical protein M8J76_009268 [Diaphorina citri]KAI5717581.1 hypothetical protein M8J77_008100 [Diaphorina citri]